MVADAVRSGTERSPAFAALVHEVERLGGIVYVEEGRCPGAISACLRHFVTAVGSYRMLFVNVHLRRSGATLIALVGHELTHALEVLRDARVDTGVEIYQLFDRIGVGGPRPLAFETAAALDVERRIADDLRRHSRSPQTLAPPERLALWRWWPVDAAAW